MTVTVPLPARWLYAAIAAWLATYVAVGVADLDLPQVLGPLFSPYAHTAVLAAAAGLCALRALRSREDRLAWALIASGIACWTAGEWYFTAHFWTTAEIPMPSPADVGYLLAPPFMLAGIVMLMRSRLAGTPLTLCIDGIGAALAVGAVSAAAIFPPVVRAASGDGLQIAVSLAYPATDLVLLGFLVGAVATTGWRPDRTWMLLATGLLAFWIADSIYLVKSSTGATQPGSLDDAPWLVGLSLVSWAAWQPAPARAAETGARSRRMIAMPMAFGFVNLGVLLLGALGDAVVPAVILAGAGIAVLMLRLFLTLDENARLLVGAQDQALTDALTGLPNRRVLLRDLEAALAAGAEPSILAFFDLNGFKRFNDTLGHAAGDALLIRVGASLSTSFAPLGRAYRLGGDEFCALVAPDAAGPDSLVRGAAEAMEETTGGQTITSAFGWVELPAEAADPAEAMRIADRRMYRHKQAGAEAC